MKGMFLKIFYIYYSKWAKMAQKFQLSMTKLGANDEIRWNDGNDLGSQWLYDKKTKSIKM